MPELVKKRTLDAFFKPPAKKARVSEPGGSTVKEESPIKTEEVSDQDALYQHV